MAIVAKGTVDMSGAEPQVTVEKIMEGGEPDAVTKRARLLHMYTETERRLALTSPPPPWVVRRA